MALMAATAERHSLKPHGVEITLHENKAADAGPSERSDLAYRNEWIISHVIRNDRDKHIYLGQTANTALGRRS